LNQTDDLRKMVSSLDNGKVNHVSCSIETKSNKRKLAKQNKKINKINTRNYT